MREGGRRPFLTAEWRHLVMLNWRVDPALLESLVPVGTSLDTSGGSHYISLVGFLFRDTRVLGIPIPFHRHFEEINLRFYVRRTLGDEVRRGVCFIRELVPRVAIAITARLAYNEPYVAVPMRHRIEPGREAPQPTRVEYGWRMKRHWNAIDATPAGEAVMAAADSHESFITEHYWGYTRQRDGGTVEYHVEHPTWRVRRIPAPVMTGNPALTYGSAFGEVLRRPADSAFLADGSPVVVHRPVRLEA